MARRRFRFWIVLILITIILASGLWVRQAWYSLLQTNGIEQVNWQGLDLSLFSISFDRFDVRQVKPGRQIVAQGQGLSMAWQWNRSGVQITSLKMEQLQVDLQSEPDTRRAPSASQPLPDIPQEPPAWLPQQVSIEHFKANVLCATGQCSLDGSLSASRDATLLPLKASLTLNDTIAGKQSADPERDTHQIQLDADMDGTWPDALNLVVNLAADGERTLSAQTEYRQTDVDHTSRWSGTVDLPRLPKTKWVLDWLSQWQPFPVDDLPQQPEVVEVAAQWALQWPSEADALKQVSGSLTARANLSEPWPLPGVGTLQGNFEIGLKADRGQWLAQTVQSDLQLSQPAAWVTQLPEPLRPKNLSIKMRPAEPISETKAGQALLPINLTLKSRGKTNIDISSHLGFSTQAPWRVTLARTRVQGSLPSYAIGNWQFEQPQVDLILSGEADTESLKLTLAPNSQLQVNQVDNSETGSSEALTGLRADLSSLEIEAAYRDRDSKPISLSLQGPLAVSARQIRHPQLKAQSWELKGDLAASLERLTLSGELEANSGARADLDLRYPYNAALTVDVESRLSGKQGSDSWAALVKAWPSTLGIEDGTVVASATLTQPQSSPAEMSGTLEIEDLAGTYNRMAWTGLDSYLTADLHQNRFTVQTSNLSFAQINPGIAIKTVTLAGSYQARSDTPATGKLMLKEASAGVLGGDVRVKPQTWDLSQWPIQFVLDVNRLQLSKLMALYPAENLSGTGILSGQLPLGIGPEGVNVAGGEIRALAPGGRLQLPGERLQAFAQGNAAMRVVAEAMKDFHYSVLNSTIDYARDGALMLGLHIEGNNPKVSAGQPVVLNINLEENIPALLTTLQLSGRVNDAVTERVKKLIERQQSDDSSELEIKGGIE